LLRTLALGAGYDVLISALLASGVDHLEIYVEVHYAGEECFIADGRPSRVMTKARKAIEIPELTDEDLARAIPRKQRERILRGRLAGGEDVIALRGFVGLTQQQFATALGISVHTLRNWEQDRRSPEGPALALLRIAARHPRVLRENLVTSA
jgi:putative transcriptional regulator